jgi:thiol-disulfide isomerase/thioredoxin
MNRVSMAVVIVFVSLLAAPFLTNTFADEPAKPKDRVIAMYFHRTQRCPTCLKMGSYTEEAMKAAFGKQLEEGTVEFYYVDFQDQKNAALTKGYKVTGPSLIVISVKDNKAKEYRNLKQIWTKVQEKPEFLKYVQSNVRSYLK